MNREPPPEPVVCLRCGRSFAVERRPAPALCPVCRETPLGEHPTWARPETLDRMCKPGYEPTRREVG